MTLSDVAAREIAKALRKHVGMKELEQVVTELASPATRISATALRGSFTRCGWSLIGNHSRRRLAIKSQCLARCSWWSARSRSSVRCFR